MGSTCSWIVAPLFVCLVYFLYFCIYRSHKLLKRNVLNSNELPSFIYLYVKYMTRVITRRRFLHTKPASDPVYTVFNCRLQSPVLRSFCSAAGYGWDYPDSEYRDLPLCFPELLGSRLLLMLLTDKNFRLNPSGLVRVCQTLNTVQPIDELKKGPFVLQVGVQGYQQTDAGVEVDVCLSAASRSGSPVWESVLTLLSRNRLHKVSRRLQKDAAGHSDEPVPENVKQVELRVPRTIGLQCAWSFTDFSPHRLLWLPAGFFGFGSQAAPGLWMLSVCLAEIEKHKGVGVIAAPVNVRAQFKEPLPMEGTVLIRFWEATAAVDQSSAKGLCFHMQQPGHSVCHVEGLISRS